MQRLLILSHLYVQAMYLSTWLGAQIRHHTKGGRNMWFNLFVTGQHPVLIKKKKFELTAMPNVLAPTCILHNFCEIQKDNFYTSGTLRWRRICSNHAQQCPKQKDSTQPSSFVVQYQLILQLSWTINAFCLLCFFSPCTETNKNKQRKKN